MPTRPRIYHITHVDNLLSIIREGGLWSETKIIKRGGPAAPRSGLAFGGGLG
ncbi:MAG: DarT ssDNA thymidine ADP-ribosyltransferase family protein [Bacteroidota bacterium]